MNCFNTKRINNLTCKAWFLSHSYDDNYQIDFSDCETKKFSFKSKSNFLSIHVVANF